MGITSLIAGLFKSSPQYGTGALREPVEDSRNIQLGSFQKPVGAAQMADVRGMEETIEKLDYFLDQRGIGACVPHAISMLLMLYLYRKTGTLTKLSPRYGYILCKQSDGIPDTEGTYPRIGALKATADGFATDTDVPNDTTLSVADYLNFPITDTVRAKARQVSFPGFAFVEPTIEAIKEAIYQNGAVTGGTEVGNWSKLPLRPYSPKGNHYTLWYRVEDVGDDHRIYIMNSWGKGWLAKAKKWLYPGRGYFLWSDYQNGEVFDIIAYTDVPADLLTRAKAAPYRFSRELGVGSVGPDVKELQKYLNSEGFLVATDGVGSKGKETSTFGSKTKTALATWQLANGIRTTGYFGPLSMQTVNARLPKVSLVDAIIQVESGGDDNAVGDKHLIDKAYGCMQIRQPAMDDVNRIWGTHHQAQDCLGNRALSIKVFETYTGIYYPNGTDEQKARCWNGGRGGVLYPERTNVYWAKVKRIINA